MAGKKPPPPKQNILLELLLSRDEAEQKITKRIDKGKKIIEAQIEDTQGLKSIETDYNKWNDFNNELLKRIFTTQDLCEEYNEWDGQIPVVRMKPKNFHEKASDLKENIDTRIHRLESIIERLELIPESVSANTVSALTEQPSINIDSSKIFIVHGHDDAAKLEVARFIEKIGFDPIILHEQASGSKTIIEKIEAYSDVGFSVVIYTPCDVGKKDSESSQLKGRARQNVVFEHGFLIGKLGRSKVCSLVKGDVETPNDISGIVYTSMDSDNWQVELAKELKAANYPVDMNKVI